MLDASSIIATITGAMNTSETAISGLMKTFSSGVSGMSLSGSEAASSVMSSTNGDCKAMSAKMEDMFARLQNELNAHQKMQQGETPADFKMGKSDLRETVARGFPEEKPAFLTGKKRL